MSLRAKDRASTLRTPFAAAAAATVLIPAVAPTLPFHYFCPLMALAFYRARLITCLWIALAAGFTLDLLASHGHLGIYSLSYCATAALLFRYKGHLFEDNITTLPLMTLLFSAISTGFAALLYHAFEQPLTFSWTWIASELIMMSILDGLLALSCVLATSLLQHNQHAVDAEEMVADRPK